MIKTGIIFADEKEFAPFLKYNRTGEPEVIGGLKCVTVEEGGNRVIGVLCGIGKVNAATAAALLIYRFGVDRILNAGLSGAVEDVSRDEVIAGESYVECDFDLSPLGLPKGHKPGEELVRHADPELLKTAVERLGIRAVRLGTGDVFLTDKELKDEYSALFHVNAFDMETAAIASVCEKNGVPFLSIRKISDGADGDSIVDYREMNDKEEIDLSVCLEKLVFGGR